MDIQVKSNVKHNGKWFEPGEEIKKIKADDGKRLIDLGVAVEVEAPKASDEEKAKKEAEKKAKAEEAAREEKEKAELAAKEKTKTEGK